MVPDDVFITGIGGQALDIFPHSPESAQMVGNISKGCYLFLRAGLPQVPSHLRQYLERKKRL